MSPDLAPYVRSSREDASLPDWLPDQLDRQGRELARRGVVPRPGKRAVGVRDVGEIPRGVPLPSLPSSTCDNPAVTLLLVGAGVCLQVGGEVLDRVADLHRAAAQHVARPDHDEHAKKAGFRVNPQLEQDIKKRAKGR